MTSPLRVALVTGSSRGIGRAIAEQLGSDGFSVVVNYARSRDAAEKVVAGIGSSGSAAIAIQGSVAKADDRRRLIDAAYDEWGRLDLLVNNAGITSVGRNDVLEATEESWNVVLGTNLKGPFFLSQYAANRMVEQVKTGSLPSAHIININSISGFAVSVNRADYCIAKAGMTMMTQVFASRLAEHDILVHEVAPGVIATDMTAGVKAKYDQRIADGLSPIARWGEPEDVAKAVSALVSGQFAFSTGESIRVDGGFHIRRL